MAKQSWLNNWSATTTSSITASSTSVTIDPSKASLLDFTDKFYLFTLVGYSSLGVEDKWEIVKATAKTGSTLTIERAQESTTARSWPTGTKLQIRYTAGSADYVREQAEERRIELENNGTTIRWRYVNTLTWYDLVPVEDLAGAGTELSTNATHILWRPVGTTTWNNLVAIDDLSYVDMRSTPTHIQWKRSTQTDWTNLVDISAIGDAGGAVNDVYGSNITVDLATAKTWVVHPTDNCTITLTGGAGSSPNVIVKQTNPAYNVTFLPSVKWSGFTDKTDLTSPQTVHMFTFLNGGDAVGWLGSGGKMVEDVNTSIPLFGLMFEHGNSSPYSTKFVIAGDDYNVLTSFSYPSTTTSSNTLPLLLMSNDKSMIVCRVGTEYRKFLASSFGDNGILLSTIPDGIYEKLVNISGTEYLFSVGYPSFEIETLYKYDTVLQTTSSHSIALSGYGNTLKGVDYNDTSVIAFGTGSSSYIKKCLHTSPYTQSVPFGIAADSNYAIRSVLGKFSHDGTKFAFCVNKENINTNAFDTTLFVGDMTSNALVHTFPLNTDSTTVDSICWSDNGRYIAVFCGTTVYTADTTTEGVITETASLSGIKAAFITDIGDYIYTNGSSVGRKNLSSIGSFLTAQYPSGLYNITIS